MKPLRVLIVDDSATARELIAGILTSDPELEVVGQAADGIEAVNMIQQLKPDVVTMDIHMPRLNGLEATREVMTSCPTPIVIVSSTTLVHDVHWAMGALQAGALTLLLKPPGPSAPDYQAAARELIETVKAMSGVKLVRRRSANRAAARPARKSPNDAGDLRRVFAIAASTGGPPAIKEALASLPADFPDPILVTQHIAKGFSEGFVRWLDSQIAMEVRVAENLEKLTGGVVYVAAEDIHLGITSELNIELARTEPIDGFRPSATHLFRSVAQSCGKNAVGVILTGMGTDGVDGLRELHAGGGHVIAQDEASCVVFGMPSAAIDEGIVDATLPIDQICQAIEQLSRTASFR